MSSHLVNFSVETDTMVLLQYKDGQQRRVPVAQLSEHLDQTDLARVQSALKLRRDFIKAHMPKAGIVMLAVLGLAAALFSAERTVAYLMHQREAGEIVPHDTLVQAQPLATPAPTPTLRPIVSSAQLAVTPAPVPRSGTRPRSIMASQTAVREVSRVVVPSATPVPSPPPTPVASPLPTRTPSITPPPTPSPSPTPVPDSQGKVAGDCDPITLCTIPSDH